jgi:hypothetical protein
MEDNTEIIIKENYVQCEFKEVKDIENHEVKYITKEKYNDKCVEIFEKKVTL